MEMNLLELKYMIDERKAEIEENIRVANTYKLVNEDKRKKYCVRLFGFEVCI